jgi:dTDP-4-dehydrorhamnose 3,5-epimerase
MFNFSNTELPGVILAIPKVFEDERGIFFEAYKRSDFFGNGIAVDFVQSNESFSKKDVLRGLHFQEGAAAQAKLVRCVNGEIFDVAVDIRKDSPTFLKWVSAVLSGENKHQLFIPTGFAHGFCVLSDTARVTYSCSSEYDPKAEKGIIWNDPDIGIRWPVKVPILSPKDKEYPTAAQL